MSNNLEQIKLFIHQAINIDPFIGMQLLELRRSLLDGDKDKAHDAAKFIYNHPKYQELDNLMHSMQLGKIIDDIWLNQRPRQLAQASQ